MWPGGVEGGWGKRDDVFPQTPRPGAPGAWKGGTGQRETEGEKDIKCSNQNEKWSCGYFKQELIHH